MPANSTQVGGTHYKTKYEHWDMVAKYGLGYFDAQIARYITRWRNKDGMKDLNKALHFSNKMLELVYDPSKRAFNPWPVRPWVYRPDATEDLAQYAEANGLGAQELEIIIRLVLGPSGGALEAIRDKIAALMQVAEEEFNYNKGDPGPVPRTDSNKHAAGQEDQ